MTLNECINKISGCRLYEDIDLRSFTTFRLPAKGDLVEVQSISSLQELLPLLNKFQKKYLVVGWGANQILPINGDQLILHLDIPFDENELKEVKETYNLPASLGLSQLSSHAIKFGLKGWEVFTGIPASLGGAIFMNAGTNLGEIGSLIKSVTIVTPEGSLRVEIIGFGSFSYRKNNFVKEGEIIVGAEVGHFGIDTEIPQKIKSYLEYRKTTQPLNTRNCGCVFKNVSKNLQAGRMIDLMSLKGVGIEGLRISPKHANFMENIGDGDWNKFNKLVDLVNFYADHFYGIEFELEVKIPYH